MHLRAAAGWHNCTGFLLDGTIARDAGSRSIPHGKSALILTAAPTIHLTEAEKAAEAMSLVQTKEKKHKKKEKKSKKKQKNHHQIYLFYRRANRHRGVWYSMAFA